MPWPHEPRRGTCPHQQGHRRLGNRARCLADVHRQRKGGRGGVWLRVINERAAHHVERLDLEFVDPVGKYHDFVAGRIKVHVTACDLRHAPTVKPQYPTVRGRVREIAGRKGGLGSR